MITCWLFFWCHHFNLRYLPLSSIRLAPWALESLVCNELLLMSVLGFRLAEVLPDKVLAELLLKADESDKKAFSHWSKFQILIQKGRTSEGIRWLFLGVPLGSVYTKKKLWILTNHWRWIWWIFIPLTPCSTTKVWWTCEWMAVLWQAFHPESSSHDLPGDFGAKESVASDLGKDWHGLCWVATSSEAGPLSWPVVLLIKMFC